MIQTPAQYASARNRILDYEKQLIQRQANGLNGGWETMNRTLLGDLLKQMSDYVLNGGKIG